MADLAREIGSRIRTQAVPGRDVAWVDTLDPLTVTLHGTTQAATNLSGQRLAVGDRVLVQRAGGSMIITHLHEARPQSGVVVGVTPGGDVVVEAGGREIEHVPVVDDASESVAELGRKPASAEGLSVSTWPYTDTDGANRGAVSVSWDPVVEGTDGASVVVDHYKIAVQHGPDAPWGVVLQTPLTEGEILNLDPGTDLGVTVHAVSEAGVTGPAPAHVRIVVAEDTTPPPVPAAPTGVSAMGTVTWTLSGKGVGGVPMPADYQHTILTCTGVRDGATVVSTHTVSGRGTVVAGPYDRGTTATASAVSVDRSGNESDDSPTATVAVKSVMDDSPLTGWRDELEDALETLDTDVLDIRDNVLPPLSISVQTALDNAASALADAERAYQAAIDAASGGPNLVANGGFELGDTGWTTNANQQTTVVPDAHNGERVMVLTLDGGNRWPQSTPALSVEGERTYMVSVYVRAAQGSAQFHPYMRYRPAGGTWGATSGELETVTGYQWRRVTAELTTPAGIDEVQFAPRGLQTAGAVLHVDDFTVHDITDAAEAITIARNALQEARDAMDAANVAALAAGEARSIALGADKRVKVGYGPPVAADGAGVPNGGIWWEYGGSPQTLRGMWVWSGTTWQKRDLDRTIIPLIDIGSGTFGDLDGVRLKAHTVATGALAVGGGDNLIADPGFTDPDLRNTQRTTTGTVWNTWGPDQPSAAAALRINTGQETANRNAWLSLGVADREWAIPVTAGQEYVMRVWFRGDVGNIWRWTAATYAADGTRSYIGISPWITNTTATGWAEHVWTIPAGVVAVAPAAQTQPFPDPSNTGAVLQFEMPSFRHRIDGVVIKDGAVRAPHMYADIAMANFMAALYAEFDTAFIGKLEADAIRSGSWIGRLLAGVNVKISDDPDDPLAEHIMLANLAMRIMRGDGDGGLYEATSLGGAGLDQLSMRPSASGSPRVVISGDGNASFAGHASVGTLAVGGELLSERLARLPQGIMADFPVSGSAIRSWGNTNYGLVRLSWQAQAGRRYKLSMKLNLQGQLDDSYWLTIRTARGSTQPTVGSAIFAEDYGTLAPNAAVGSSNHDTHEHEFTIMDTVTGTLNALVVIRTWNANREMRLRPGGEYVSRFTLEDMGFVDGASVVVDPGGGSPFTGTAPAPVPQPTPHQQTLHRTSWRSFRNGSTYSGAAELEHGTWNGIVRRSQLLFPAIPSGATNIRAKLRIRATHTWAGTGATFYVGIGTESSLQTSVPGHSAGAQHHFARNEEREIPLPGWTTAHRSVWFGIGAPGTNASYGRLDPSSAYIVYDYDLA